MKSIASYILEKLLFPFKHDMLYLVVLWIIMSSPFCFQQLSSGNHIFSVYIALLYYAISYAIVFCLDINKTIGHYLKPLVLIIFMLWSTANFYCLIKYECFLTNDFIQIIRETNPDEAKEYFSTFFTWTECLLIVLLIIACIVLSVVLSRITIKKHTWRWIPACLLFFISIATTYHNPSIIHQYLFSKEFRWQFHFNSVIDLRQHQTHPHIISKDSIHPQYIVTIIGESFSRNHCSLLGYAKKTNPLLQQEDEDQSLIVFNNITSPRAYTTQSFKYLLNTLQLGDKEADKWYDKTNIIEALKNVGYHTSWLSNQYNNKVNGSIPFSYSIISDDSFFTNEDSEGHKYDGALLKYDITTKDQHSHHFIVYHLMGQHEAFKERYPEEFSQFKATDYIQSPEHQREILAAYDNATLYNDFVVKSIIDKYKEKDAVVFYLSDHGLDVFDTDPDFFGHAKATPASTEHCRHIPFMVYVSPTFQDKRPELVKRMREAAHKEFCADKLIYCIMDAAGYRFADNNDVDNYSLFKQ